jgi:uncharacterized protein YutE (UPF0331/DUF86 family)
MGTTRQLQQRTRYNTSTAHKLVDAIALVHLYWQLDYERIYDSLQGRFASLDAFASHIERWLQDQS